MKTFKQLSVRTRNALWNAGLENAGQVRRAMAYGKLSVTIKRGKISPRNYGLKSHNEVREWLGLQPEGKPKMPTCKCPNCGFVLKDYRIVYT